MAGQKIASLYAEIGADTSGLEKGLAKSKAGLSGVADEAGKAQGKIGKFAAGFGKFAATTAVTALGAAFVASTKSSIEFESSFAKIKGLTDTAASSIDGLKKSVVSMSRDIPVSANEMAKALYYISSSGYQGAQAMDILKMSSKAAAAGLGETQIIADAITSALNAYGLEAKDAARITDVLTMAVKEGKGEPAELAGSLGRVLPVAAAAGVSMEQVAASMSIMTRTGMSADEAATALRGTIGSLLAPSKESVDALAAIGLTTDDVAKMLKSDSGLVGVLDLLMERTGGNVAELDKLIPNIRALTGVLSTSGSQGKEYTRVLEAMGNAAGATDEAFAAMSGTLEFKLKKAQNSLEAFGNSITSKLLPPLGDAADAASTLINWNDKLAEAVAGVESDLRANAGTWEDYRNGLLGAAVAAGTLTQAQANAYISGNKLSMGMGGNRDVTNEVTAATGIVAEANFKAARAYAAAEGQLDKYDQAVVNASASLKDNAASAEFAAIETDKMAKAAAKASLEIAQASAEAKIGYSGLVESLTTEGGGVKFDALEGAKMTIQSLEDLMRENPENAENYAAKLRAIKEEYGLISQPAEAAATSFGKLQQLWMDGAISTDSYAKALSLIQVAAKDGAVSVDELGLKTGEAAAYMTLSAGNAKTAQDGIVNDARANKEKMMDEMGNAMEGQQTTLQNKISDSMLSVSKSLGAAKSLATTTADDIIIAWGRIPTEVTTNYKINLLGATMPETTPDVPARAQGGPVMANQSYMVGERGPELLTMGGMGGYVSPNINNTVNAPININAGNGVNINALAAAVSQRIARDLRGANNSGAGYRS